MSLPEEVIEILRTTGGGAGVIGGVVTTILFRKFRSLETGVKKTKDVIAAIEKIKLELNDLRSGFEAYKRGSRPDLLSESWTRRFHPYEQRVAAIEGKMSLVEGRVTALESRMSALEDDFDEARRKDQNSWEAIQRALGRIEGKLERDQASQSRRNET